jgi:hypothetical protein
VTAFKTQERRHNFFYRLSDMHREGKNFSKNNTSYKRRKHGRAQRLVHAIPDSILTAAAVIGD